MKRDFSLWSWIGFAVVSFAGTLLHFLYEWSGERLWAAPFSGVNESTWEHMKLLFFPLFFFAVFQWFFFRDEPRFWHIKLRGTVTGLVLIPILFYTYNGAFGKSPDWINITIFFLSAAAAFLLENKLLKEKKDSRFSGVFSFLWLLLMGALFVFFTFLPPSLPLFQDPISGSYGR